MTTEAERQAQAEAWVYNSGQFLDDLITGKREPTKENLSVARFASAMLGHRIRLASISANQERDLLRFAGRLAKDPEELGRYVAAALPASGFTRMLNAGLAAKKEVAA